MKRPLPKLCLIALISGFSVWIATRSAAQLTPETDRPSHDKSSDKLSRPQYQINAAIDYDLLTFKSTGTIKVPVAPGDSLRDVVFFIYANAGGVGGDDERRKNIKVDEVALNGEKVPFTLDGAVLRVKLPQPQSTPFALKIEWHGVVPRSPAGAGGLADMMGGMSGDLGGLLGGLGLDGATTETTKPKNVDYGLYTYGNGVLSLGSFWYPSLAVRKNGKWVDDAPEGLGDVGYAEMSDFDVTIRVPSKVVVAATNHLTGKGGAPMSVMSELDANRFIATNVRDFAVLMSEDYAIKATHIEVAGKQVSVAAYTTKKDMAKANRVLDIATHALQIYSKRFGPYPYSHFKVVEGPIRGGAGGMEFSGMTSIASFLYQDMGKQLEGLAGALGVTGLDKVLGGLEEEAVGANQTQNDEAAQNPASEMLTGLLGQQKEIFDSLLEVTIAHEVAHQWWAVGVGSDSQRAPFIDESLANYSAMLYFEDRYGKEKAQQMIDLHLKTSYSMGRMLGGGDAPVNLSTAAYKNNLQYGAVVYGKGALYYDALRKVVGDEVFFKSLRQYFAKYSGKLAPARALLEIVKTNAPTQAKQVDALFTRWIEGAHGDEDISGGKVMGVEDLLGGLLGGMTGAGELEQ